MKYFILGILFMLFAQPVATAFTNFICAFFEMLQTKLEKITAKEECDIKKMVAETAKLITAEEEGPLANPIGFMMDDPVEDCCEEELVDGKH